MKRIWMNVGVTLGTALITGAIVSACAHNDASIFIRQVFAPTIPSNGVCTFTPDPTQPFISVGTVDVSFAVGTYTPIVLVGNQILSQANQNAEQAETSRVIIDGAITRITDLNGNTSLVPMFLQMYQANADAAARTVGSALNSGKITPPINPFSTVESSAIEPAAGTTPSYAPLGLTLVDSATVGIIRAYFDAAMQANPSAALGTSIELLTYTKLEGKTLGGDSVESNEFEFPVRFTYGGLVSNLYTDPGTTVGYCLDTKITLPTTLQTCVYGQDVAVVVGALGYVPDCRLGDGGASPIDAGPG